MWKFILVGALSLCLGGSSALAQSGRLPQLRNEAATAYQFTFVCARATGTITIDPGQTVFIDAGISNGGCQLGSKAPQSPSARPPVSGAFTANSLCRVTRTGDLVCSEAASSINLQVTRADKPVLVLLDGAPFVPSALASGAAFSKNVLAGPHTLSVIGTGKGTFDITATWVAPNGSLTAMPLVRGASPAALGGDTWMVSQTFQMEPVAR